MKGQRFELTEEEGEKLLEICNEFYEAYSVAVAKAALKAPSPDLIELVFMRCQEACSSPRYLDWDFAKGEWNISLPENK